MKTLYAMISLSLLITCLTSVNGQSVPVIETSEMKNMLSKRCMTLGPKISDPTFLLGIENDVYHVYPSPDSDSCPKILWYYSPSAKGGTISTTARANEPTDNAILLCLTILRAKAEDTVEDEVVVVMACDSKDARQLFSYPALAGSQVTDGPITYIQDNKCIDEPPPPNDGYYYLNSCNGASDTSQIFALF